MIASFAHVVLALVLAPLLPGIINRTKAVFAGRRGQPLLQLYFDLFKLLRKGAVYSRTTTWVFKAGPVVGLACVLVALALVPLGGVGAVVSFQGDLLLLAYVLGLMRFFTVLAALDTGSSFEAMGASREVQFAMLAEPALLLGLLPVLMHWGDLSGVIAIVLASTAIKAGVLLWLLRRALREAQVSREVEPLIGFGLSLILGIGLLVLSIYLAGRLPLPAGAEAAGRFAVSVALFTSLVGLLLIVSRRKALMQVLGYLAMENGIYAFGLAFAIRESLIVELGILLDVFVAVFVMGIMIYHINREFDHIDTDRLSALRD